MKDKTISLRVEVPTYASLITKAHESKKTLTDYILDKLQEDKTNEIKALKANIKQLEGDLKKKPKTVTKEVVKVDEKALKAAKDEIKALKANIKQLEGDLKKKPKTVTKEVVKVDEKALKAANSKIDELSKYLNQLKKNNKELVSFINSLDLRKHSDGFSIGGRAFSEGEKVKI